MKPWREIAVPHKDVLDGTFYQSEFAADLTQVHTGSASPEYQDPERFFARTYLTPVMKQLLKNVAKRFCGMDAEPVVNLQTNFGGGKTHTMLAVYHLAQQKCPVRKMEGVNAILDDAGVTSLPKVRVAVIDGMNCSVNEPMVVEGKTIKTLWGRIAWQLGGLEAYGQVEASDQAGTSPGKDILVPLLKKAAPCVILMDELSRYMGNILSATEVPKAGSFDNNTSFMQALTESVKAVKNAQLVVSLLESKRSQLGGQSGLAAKQMLEDIFSRNSLHLRTGSSDEGFEIVKRRLFESIDDAQSVNEICRAFAKMYQEEPKFATEERKAEYEERLRKCYPIHPEVFDRLYNDWSTLDGFQQTRGVLQLMAAAIHRLWTDGNKDLMIMPGSLPFFDPHVKDKCLTHLGANWNAVVDGEVDGPGALPTTIDDRPENVRFGSVQAARRVARTIFVGSAPRVKEQAARGVSVQRILLGTMEPGRSTGVFEDVLKRLNNSLQYLYSENDNLYWYDTHPNLRREMENIRDHVSDGDVTNEIAAAINKLKGQGNNWEAVQVFPLHEDVPDQIGTGLRLVVIPPKDFYMPNDSRRAYEFAKEMLEFRGTSRRSFRNRLIFLASDGGLLKNTQDAARTAMAWEKIVSDIDGQRHQDLDGYQVQQAKNQKVRCQEVFRQSVLECFRWVLVPQQKGRDDVDFRVEKVDYNDKKMAVAIEDVLVSKELIIPRWASIHLKNVLKEWYFKDGVVEKPIKTVWEDLGKFYYMNARLTRCNVFENAVIEGVREGRFGYAQGKDGNKYDGLTFKEELLMAHVTDGALLVEAEVAEKYKREHEPTPEPTLGLVPQPGMSPNPVGQGPQPIPGGMTTEEFRGFFASCEIDKVRGLNKLSQIWNELVLLFTRADPDIRADIKFDMTIGSDKPFDKTLMRNVKENLSALGIQDAGFTKDNQM